MTEDGRGVNVLIDSDTHLFEPPGMWREYVDPAIARSPSIWQRTTLVIPG